MSDVSIRRATADDLRTIIELLADDELGHAREDTGPSVNPGYLRAFDAIDADANQFLAVAEQNGEVVGCMQLSFLAGLSHVGLWRGQIEAVRIAAARRGSGIGRIMIRWAIDECARRGCGMVQLTSNKARRDAIRFYESLGFAASHEGMKLTL